MEHQKIDNAIKTMEKQIVINALIKDILTIDDLPRYMRKYIDDYGNDSFINYLSVVLADKKIGGFLTMCKPLIKDKEEIEKKFGIKIMSMEELSKLKKSEKQ
jgi:F0F1-type ATP synthase delta subunit